MGCARLQQRCRGCCDSSLAAPVSSSFPAGCREGEGGLLMEGMRRGGLPWAGLFYTSEFHCLVSGHPPWSWGRWWREQRRAGGWKGRLGAAGRNQPLQSQLQLGKILKFFFLQMLILKYFTPRRLWGGKTAGVMDLLVPKSLPNVYLKVFSKPSDVYVLVTNFLTHLL